MKRTSQAIQRKLERLHAITAHISPYGRGWDLHRLTAALPRKRPSAPAAQHVVMGDFVENSSVATQVVR